MWILLLGLILFIGIHSVRMIAPAYREQWISEKGGGSWKTVYSVVSIVGLILIIWGYSRAWHDASVIYVPPDWGRPVALVLMLIALIIMFSFDLKPGYIKATIKHPMVTAIIIWSGAHLLVNGDSASVLMFGSMLVWAIWNRIDIVRRPQPQFDAISAKYDLIAIALGVAVYALFIWKLHYWLFGAQPIVFEQ